MDLLGESNNHTLSIIKDPFLKDCVGNIGINRSSWGGKYYWWGRVEFINGNTKGEQKTPDCETFEEVLSAVKQILNSIKR